MYINNGPVGPNSDPATVDFTCNADESLLIRALKRQIHWTESLRGIMDATITNLESDIAAVCDGAIERTETAPKAE